MRSSEDTINSSIPSDILKIQKKMCEFEKDSRNYNKYKKILAKHTKNYMMKKRVNSNIKTIEELKEIL
jgi:hypothetical protein